MQVQSRAGANTCENFALATQAKEDFERYLSEYLARRIYDDLQRTGS